MTAAEQYTQISIYFERALDGLNIEPAFKGAIKAMQICPEQLSSVFNATLWELIEAVCNKNIIPTKDEERWEYFLAGCGLLENFDDREAQHE